MAKISTMFDNIIEMQTNPDGEKARDFEKQMEEFEKNNPNKTKTQVLIRTVKQGRLGKY